MRSHWRQLRARAVRWSARFRSERTWGRISVAAKAHWLQPHSGERCAYAPLIYEAAQPSDRWRVLEFGANFGGNLTYFLDRHPSIEAIGVDINPVVRHAEAAYSTYRGIIGDESALDAWPPDRFDLAFTVSVLDHIPDPRTVQRVLERLIAIAPKVILLEPVIAGVHGDVSGRYRGEVAPNLPGPHKVFAAHSYIWDYDRWLARWPVRWSCRPQPLHAASCGPFYHLYVIERLRAV